MARIKKVKVTHLALCKRGANQLPVLYKSADGDAPVAWEMLVKEGTDFDEKGELLFVGYVPHATDIQGHEADVEVCKEMCYTHAEGGNKLNIRHGDVELRKDQAYVAENFIIQESDERFHNMTDYNGKPIDATNGWGGVIKIVDPAIRKLYKSEGWNGVSLQGPATLEKSDDTELNLLQRLVKLLKGEPTQTPKTEDEDEMKIEELTAALAKSNEALIAALKPAPAKPEEKATTTVAKSENEEKPPEYKGAMDDEVALAKHVEALEHFELRKSVVWTDPKSVSAYLAKMKEDKEAKAAEAGEEDDDNPFETKKPIKKEQQRSDQPTRTASKNGRMPVELQDVTLSKEEREGMACGDRMAAFINGPG